MEVFLTVVTGFVTFALGQIAVKLVIDPVQEFKRVVADISHALIEYANIFGNPGITGPENERKVSGELRKLSSRLNAQMYLIPAYGKTSKLFGLPTRENVTKAAGHLIGLSNGFGGNNPERGVLNTYRAQHVCDALGIYISERERLDPALEKEFLNGPRAPEN
jgi:hypothetical protein